MTAPAVRLEREGMLARVVLDRPPVNVLNLDALESLRASLVEASADPHTKVVVLAGEGRAFCAGVDVADHTAERVDRMLELFHGVLLRLLTLRMPTVAVVHGAALGGGCELALACDIVLASAGAKLGLPEIRLGVFPPAAAAMLPCIVGRQRAMDLVLSGRTVSGAEAQDLGLAARSWPAEEFDAAAREYVEGLAAHSGPVLRLAKRAVIWGAERPPIDALEFTEALYRDELMALADAHEGIAAFLERRAPAWREC